jgi:hypothetical protein
LLSAAQQTAAPGCGGGGGGGGGGGAAAAAAEAGAGAADAGAEGGSAAAAVPKVLLQFRLPGDKQVLKLKVPKAAPLQQAMDAFAAAAAERGWVPAGAAMRYEFDGDRLTGKETAEGNDMDNDDLVDVRVAGR